MACSLQPILSHSNPRLPPLAQHCLGLAVNALGKSAFFPFTVLLNAVLSMTTKWQYAGENAIRASGVEYTIVRPPKLVDDDRCGVRWQRLPV